MTSDPHAGGSFQTQTADQWEWGYRQRQPQAPPSASLSGTRWLLSGLAEGASWGA